MNIFRELYFQDAEEWEGIHITCYEDHALFVDDFYQILVTTLKYPENLYLWTDEQVSLFKEAYA